jgi:hypothetical protein
VSEASRFFNVKRGAFAMTGVQFATPKTLDEARVAYRQHLVGSYLRAYDEFVSTEAEIPRSELSFRLTATDRHNMVLGRVTNLG